MTLAFRPVMTRILAPLVLVALLSCHGFLGAPQHVPGPPPDHPHDVSYLAGDHAGHVEHSIHAPAGEVGEHPGAHLGYSGYAAALISVLLGAVIGLLLSGVRAWSKHAVSSWLSERSFPPLILHHARRPTAPLMQVFRL